MEERVAHVQWAQKVGHELTQYPRGPAYGQPQIMAAEAVVLEALWAAASSILDIGARLRASFPGDT